MAVPFMDLSRLHKPLKEDLHRLFEECIDSNDFILGPHLKSFEENFARFTKAPHAVGVGSGTDALLLTLHGLGIGPGDEVICPSFGFVATADIIVRLGATVTFVDVNDNFTLDVDSVRVAITEKTRAIIPVHLFGLAADVEALNQLADDFGIYMVEDCAQAIGAEVNGRAVGTFGIAGCYSYYPTKNLGGMGDGGMIVTKSDELAERIRLFRDHGRDKTGRFVEIGYNSRLDSMQAAILNLKLQSLQEDNEDRIANATYYDSNLSHDAFGLPALRDDGSHVYNCYTIRHPHRDELKNFLAERGIQTAIYYPQPMHLQPCFEWLGYREGHFAKSESSAKQVLSLPIFPGLMRKEMDEIVHTLDLYAKTHPMSAAS